MDFIVRGPKLSILYLLSKKRKPFHSFKLCEKNNAYQNFVPVFLGEKTLRKPSGTIHTQREKILWISVQTALDGSSFIFSRVCTEAGKKTSQTIFDVRILHRLN